MKEITIFAGCNLDKALSSVKEVAEKTGDVCCARFNGVEIFSTDTVDDAYKKVLGKTKAEFDEDMRKMHEAYVEKERKFKEKIPKLTEYYRKEARGLVRKEELKHWDNLVPHRLEDIYHGMELQQVLDCCKIMRDESFVYAARLEKAYDVVMAAGHSGNSAQLVRLMLLRFCPHGIELSEAIRTFRFAKSKT